MIPTKAIQTAHTELSNICLYFGLSYKESDTFIDMSQYFWSLKKIMIKDKKEIIEHSHFIQLFRSSNTQEPYGPEQTIEMQRIDKNNFTLFWKEGFYTDRTYYIFDKNKELETIIETKKG